MLENRPKSGDAVGYNLSTAAARTVSYYLLLIFYPDAYYIQ